MTLLWIVMVLALTNQTYGSVAKNCFVYIANSHSNSSYHGDTEPKNIGSYLDGNSSFPMHNIEPIYKDEIFTAGCKAINKISGKCILQYDKCTYTIETDTNLKEAKDLKSERFCKNKNDTHSEGIILENIGGFCMFTSTMPMNVGGDKYYILSQSYVEWGQPVLKQWVVTTVLLIHFGITKYFKHFFK